MIIPLLTGRRPLGELASLLDAPWEGKDAFPSRLVTDSREIEKGDLFCALKGKDDGHLYAKEAEKRGAVAILAERKTEAALPHILVDSVPSALLRWASLALAARPVLKIAITGSVGKTTAKEKCAAVLKERYKTHKTEGNRNNHLGVPFTVLSMPLDTEALVLELGMNNRGEIKALSSAVRPDVAIITNIGYAHIGRLGSREAIAEAKMEILSGMQATAPLLIPMGEPLLAPCFTRRQLHYVLPLSEKEAPFPIPTDIGERWGLGFALRLGRLLGISEDALWRGLLDAAKAPTRRQVFTLRGVTLINDTYNASPESTIAALDLLQEQRGKGKRIALLGTMLELGDASSLLHRAVARHAARCADYLLYYGEEEEAVLSGALGGGMPKERILTFPTLEKAKPVLLALMAKGDAILFKASRGMYAERLFAAALEQCKNL